MSASVRVEPSALEPFEREELADLLDALYARLGVKPADVLAVNVTPKRVTLRLKLRGARGRTIPHAWAHLAVDVLEGVADDDS